MRSKRTQEDSIPSGRRVAGDEAGAALLPRVRGDLQRRGVASDLCERIAARLCERHRVGDLSLEQYEALIEGAVLAYGVHSEIESDSVDSASQVREVERMMQAFAGELEKLDESLEVLATYVRRMRTDRSRSTVETPLRGSEILH